MSCLDTIPNTLNPISDILELNVITIIMNFLLNLNEPFLIPSIKIVTNLLAGSDEEI